MGKKLARPSEVKVLKDTSMSFFMLALCSFMTTTQSYCRSVFLYSKSAIEVSIIIRSYRTNNFTTQRQVSFYFSPR